MLCTFCEPLTFGHERLYVETATVGRLTTLSSGEMKTIGGHPGTKWRETCIRRAVLTVDADAPIRGPRVDKLGSVSMEMGLFL